ncbi:MAG: hypothetical protein HYX27_06115 [Acidobacteria bacterium]|nr:hypothetical protein [Acidobacteriota bacterium]
MERTLFQRAAAANGQGQDITEYTLLLAFVVVVALAVFVLAGNDIQGIWKASSTTVSAASSVAGS